MESLVKLKAICELFHLVRGDESIGTMNRRNYLFLFEKSYSREANQKKNTVFKGINKVF